MPGSLMQTGISSTWGHGTPVYTFNMLNVVTLSCSSCKVNCNNCVEKGYKVPCFHCSSCDNFLDCKIGSI